MRIKNSFLFGLLTGVGIGYYLASDDKEELIERVKDTAAQARDVVEGGIEKGRKLVDDIRSKKNDA
jgi:hypothetical protein